MIWSMSDIFKLNILLLILFVRFNILFLSLISIVIYFILIIIKSKMKKTIMQKIDALLFKYEYDFYNKVGYSAPFISFFSM
jgi:hypothetical protein